MKTKILAVAVVILFASVLLFNSQKAQADIQPILAVDNVYTAVNAGEADSAVNFFAEDAVVTNWVRGETYAGHDQIQLMLDSLQRESRQYDIVDVEMSGNTIELKVEVSDYGVVWGTESIVAQVKDGKVQTLQVVAFRLDL